MKDIIFSVAIGIIFVLFLVVSFRYQSYTNNMALNCDFNHTTHELIKCK